MQGYCVCFWSPPNTVLKLVNMSGVINKGLVSARGRGRREDVADVRDSIRTTPVTSAVHSPRNIITDVSSVQELGAVPKDRKCGMCTKVKGNDGILLCVSCSKWYHFKCLGVSKEQVEQMDISKWKCNVCLGQDNICADGGVSQVSVTNADLMLAIREMRQIMSTKAEHKELMDAVHDLANRNASLETQVNDMEIKIDNVITKVTDIETNTLFKTRQDFDLHLQSVLKPIEDNFKSEIQGVKWAINANIVDIMRRQKNLIIDNAPAYSNEYEFVKELADDLNIQNIDRDRIKTINKWINGQGTSTAKNMMCVVFKNEEDKFKFLSKETREKVGKWVSGDRYFGVKIYPDRSPAERIQFKEQTAEADRLNAALLPGDPKKWVVSMGRLIQVNRRTDQTQ